MAKTLAPTKGNLMMAKNTLRLSKQGYEMLDKKAKYPNQRNDAFDRGGKGSRGENRRNLCRCI